MTHANVVRSYYRALDEDDYDAFLVLLAPSFTQQRPDRTIDGRPKFIEFMENDRPDSDTTHEIDVLYEVTGDDEGDEKSPSAADAGDGLDTDSATDTTDELAARGRVVDVNGETLFEFVDVFHFENVQVVDLVTYTA